jgi:hypothetical protein
MKKLFALIALAGLGAFVAGCAEETKKPEGSPKPKMEGPGTVSPGPKAGAGADADKDKDKDGDKDMPADGDGKGDADAGAAGDSKPDAGDEKPGSEGGEEKPE